MIFPLIGFVCVKSDICVSVVRLSNSDRLLGSRVMSEALIRADMFSNSPQERPAHTVSNNPQMDLCNISSPQPVRVEGNLQGSLEKRKVSQFSFFFFFFLAFFEPSERMLLYQFYLIDPIRLLELFPFSKRILSSNAFDC